MQRSISRVMIAAGSLLGVIALSACGADGETPIADIETPRSSAANGIDDLSPAVALERVHQALEDAGTFRVEGLMRNGSQLDLGYVVGVGATGTVHDPDADSPVEILAVGGAIYVSGDDALLAEQIGEDIDETVAGKWLELSAESQARYAVFSNAESFADAVLPSAEPVTMTGVRELRGVQAIGLMFEESDAIVWVAATGQPYPIQLEEKGATADAGVLRFAVPGGDITIIAPAEEEIVSAGPAEEKESDESGDGDGDASDGGDE